MSSTNAPAPYAEHRDDASEQASRALEEHRRDFNHWQFGALSVVTSARQMYAGEALYKLTLEHSRRVEQELVERRRAAAAADHGAANEKRAEPAAKKISLPAPRKKISLPPPRRRAT